MKARLHPRVLAAVAEAGPHQCCEGAAGRCGLCLMPMPKKRAAPRPPSKAQLRARAENRSELSRHHSAKRRAERSNRTPPWADLGKIRELHREAQRLTRETGTPHHVDHVIPLQGETVSGLHVHTNMQILTGSENSRKRNRFDPC